MARNRCHWFSPLKGLSLDIASTLLIKGRSFRAMDSLANTQDMIQVQVDQSGGAPPVEYEKVMFWYVVTIIFTVISSLSILFTLIVFIMTRDFHELFYLCDLVFAVWWGFTILRDREFFWTGEITEKCRPILYVAGAQVLFSVLSFVVPQHDRVKPFIYAITHAITALIYVGFYFLSIKTHWFRPWHPAKPRQIIYVTQAPPPQALQAPVVVTQ